MRSTCVLFTLLASSAFGDNRPPPHVDLVIALDVSGSMRGLLDTTRAKLWDVVRLLGQAQPQPQVRVGLITFGGKSYDPRAGWVRRELDLTTDLDAVSQRLFSLTVRGSEEYVARTVQTAVRQMSWDQDPGALKILFVAGNESAEQDPLVSLASALGEARQRGIHVNSIYCGRPEVGEAQAWRRVAALGRGEFAAIDHNLSPLARSTPYDSELSRLSHALSSTYVGYGSRGGERRRNQHAQDEAAAGDGEQVAAARAGFKATGAYDNSDWDVLDAVAKNKKVDKLPPQLEAMPEPDRAAWVRTKQTERAELQARIRNLSGKRDAYLAPPTGAVAASTTTPMAKPAAAPAAPPTVAAAQPAKSAPKASHHARSGPANADDAFVGTVRKQATESGLAF